MPDVSNANRVLANQTILGYRAQGSASTVKYTKLCDLIDTPDDLEGDYDDIDATTLTHPSKIGFAGLQDNSKKKDFKISFLPTTRQTLESMEDHVYDFCLFIGGPGDYLVDNKTINPATASNPPVVGESGWGTYGTLEFQASFKVKFSGLAVGELIENTLSMYFANKPKYTAPATSGSGSGTGSGT